MTEEEKRSFLQKLKENISDFVYGIAPQSFTRQALKTRGSMEHLFILITMGDLLGVPILPPYYSLRLLPYVPPPDCNLEETDASREGSGRCVSIDCIDEAITHVPGKSLCEHPERRYIMFGGKGGLGKTTFSAATGFWLAQQGKRVLVFSVDPQASLSDIFQRDIFGKGAVEIMPNLYAQESTPINTSKLTRTTIRQKILDMYGMDRSRMRSDRTIQAASAEPAMEESAIFDQVVDIVVAGEFDYYIYDLVPLGHALYYLSMASVYDQWIGQITHLREEMRDTNRWLRASNGRRSWRKTRY